MTVLIAVFMCFTATTGFAEPAYGADYFSEVFYDSLVDRNGDKVSVESLSGKIVGVYFSSSGCRGCLVFSRLLVPFYQENSESFEVVLAGFDDSEELMFDYMKNYSMQWPAIPYHSASKQEIKQQHGISIIPALVILAPDGRLLTVDGVRDVQELENAALDHWKKLSQQ